MKKLLAILLTLLPNLGLAADIVIIRPDGEDFKKVNELVTAKIKNEYSMETVLVTKATEFEEFQSKIAKPGIKVVVAMDNNAIRHLKHYFEMNPQSKIRGIAAMGLNLKDLIPKNKFVSGVAYEVAGYLAIKGFKAVAPAKTRSLLGVYRSSVSRIFAEEARTQLSREKINLKLVDLEGVDDDDVNDTVRSAMKKTKADAIWLINDNKAINQKTISTLWLDVARQQKIPIICGIQKLAKELGICAYSETPTLDGTAEKIAGIVFGYIADENDADFYGVEYIQETEKTANKFLLENIGNGTFKQPDGVEIYSGEIKGR